MALFAADGAGPLPGPDFVIIGAMKCATSTLHDQLGLSESFFMSSPKEPCFFSDDPIYANGAQWYSRLFSAATADQLCGESSTHYSKLPTYPATVRRMITHLREPRFIYVMRHPIDRLVSHFIHQWSQGLISTDIDRAVGQHPELVDYGCYDMQIQPYEEAFGLQSILSVFTERLAVNPEREMRRVYRFLGVDDEPVWDPDVRSNVSSERVRRSVVHRLLVDNAMAKFLRRTFVPKSLRERIRRQWTMNERPKLSAATRAYVESLFDEDLGCLGRRFGRKLNCSTYKDVILSAVEIEWE